jgi:hypothetical protein
MGAGLFFRVPCTLKKTRAGLFMANDQARAAALLSAKPPLTTQKRLMTMPGVVLAILVSAISNFSLITFFSARARRGALDYPRNFPAPPARFAVDRSIGGRRPILVPCRLGKQTGGLTRPAGSPGYGRRGADQPVPAVG